MSQARSKLAAVAVTEHHVEEPAVPDGSETSPMTFALRLVRRRPLVFFASAVFLLRLCFINWYPGDFTDAFYTLEQEFFGPGRRMPLYPSLVIVLDALLPGDALLAGRFVSVLSGALTVVPTFLLARLLSSGSSRAAWWSAVFVAFCPLVVRWSLHCMTDALFTLTVTGAAYAGVKWLQQPASRCLALVLLTTGTAALTRPEGLMFVPPLLPLVIAHVVRTDLRSLVRGLWGAVTWAIFAWWKYFAAGSGGGYSRTMRNDLRRIDFEHVSEISAHFGGYTFMLLLLLGPICLGVLLYYADLTVRETNRRQLISAAWLSYILAAAFGVACIHFFFSTRHIVFVFPVVCAMGAVGWQRYGERARRIALGGLALSALWMLSATAFGLVVSRGTFADFREACEAATDGLEGRLFANDWGLRKSRYYTGVKTRKFKKNKLRYRTGDRVILDSFSLSLKGVRRYLAKIERYYEIRVLRDVRHPHMLFFADDIGANVSKNGKIGYTLDHVFQWQRFRSVTLEILGKKKRRTEAARLHAPTRTPHAPSGPLFRSPPPQGAPRHLSPDRAREAG